MVCPNEKGDFYCTNAVSNRSGQICFCIDGAVLYCRRMNSPTVFSVAENCFARLAAWWIPPDQSKAIISTSFAQ